MQAKNKLALLIAIGLVGCASKRGGTPDDQPTIASLAGRTVAVERDAGIKVDTEKAISAYRAFVAKERPVFAGD